MKTSAILNLSADIIEVRGWADPRHPVPNPWGCDNETSPVCLEGGILAAMGIKAERMPEDIYEPFMACPAYQAVKSYLVEKGELHPDGRLYFWNDRSRRTAEDVIGVLRAVAVIEEARERAEEKVEVPA